jgi:uncharacterized membrane protein YhaH (DUF805 family)
MTQQAPSPEPSRTTDSSSGGAPADPVGSFFAILFDFRGRIGRAKFWLGELFAVGAAVVCFVALAEANRPTGGGDIVYIGIPAAFALLWIHAAAVVKRLRDAGWTGWQQVLFILALPVWAVLTGILIAYEAFIVAVVLAAYIVLPGLMPSKEAAPA